MASSEDHSKQAEAQAHSKSSSEQGGIGAESTAPPLSQPAIGVNLESQAQGSTSARAYSSIHTAENTRFPWMFDSSGIRWSPELAGGHLDQTGSALPMVPILCPIPFPGYQGQLGEQQLRSGGIFAVPMVPVIGPLPGYPPNGLIPVSYNFPQNTPLPGNVTTPSTSQPFERAIPAQAQEAVAVGPPLQGGGPHLPPPAAAQAGQAQMPEGQRQIVRRFHVAFQIDLLLILKLAVVVFIFNQDGSRDRLFLLLFLAGLVYLYQTGALTPLLRWISQSAQRAMMPPQQQQPVRAAPADVQLRGHMQGENAPANAPALGGPAAVADNHPAAPVGEGGVAGNLGGDHVQQQAPVQGATWWGFLKEVQMLVVGFVTSLLPGFHQHMD
eukprot:c19960_g1_i1 orf=518-1666(-)